MSDCGAIVFTDIVGFTELTNEHGDDVALALLERQEVLVHDLLPECARVVKELGDGLLLWFDDADRGAAHLPRAAATVRAGGGGAVAALGAHGHALGQSASSGRRHRRPGCQPRRAHRRSRGSGRGVVLRGDGGRGRARSTASTTSRSARCSCADSPTRWRSCAPSSRRSRRAGGRRAPGAISRLAWRPRRPWPAPVPGRGTGRAVRRRPVR